MKKHSDIAHWRLTAQHIETPHFKSPQELVAYMGAMQAQDPLMSKWAVGLRLKNATTKTIEDAINKGEILRTHVMRPTWHLVAADDVYWLLELSKPQIGKLIKARYKELELSDKFLTKTNALLEKLLRDEHLTRDQVTAEFKKAKINLDNNRSSHIMMHAELEGLIVSGKLSGTKQTYALLANRVTKKEPITRDEALAKLAERYFTSHGPATLPDFTWWSGLSITDSRNALAAVKEKLVSETINGETYFLSPALKVSSKKASLHLLPAYDEFLISYKDRSASLDKLHNNRAFSSNGIFWPTLVVNGQVKGLWKRSINKDTVSIETDFFHPDEKILAKALKEAAEKFGDFLGKNVVYI